MHGFRHSEGCLALSFPSSWLVLVLSVAPNKWRCWLHWGHVELETSWISPDVQMVTASLLLKLKTEVWGGGGNANWRSRWNHQESKSEAWRGCRRATTVISRGGPGESMRPIWGLIGVPFLAVEPTRQLRLLLDLQWLSPVEVPLPHGKAQELPQILAHGRWTSPQPIPAWRGAYLLVPGKALAFIWDKSLITPLFVNKDVSPWLPDQGRLIGAAMFSVWRLYD